MPLVLSIQRLSDTIIVNIYTIVKIFPATTTTALPTTDKTTSILVVYHFYALHILLPYALLFWFSLHLFSFRFSFDILFVHYSRIMVQSLAWFFFSLQGDTCTFILKICFALFNKMGYYVINNVDSAWIYSIPPFLILSLSLPPLFAAYRPHHLFVSTHTLLLFISLVFSCYFFTLQLSNIVSTKVRSDCFFFIKLPRINTH